jgi:hypothetical protein
VEDEDDDRINKSHLHNEQQLFRVQLEWYIRWCIQKFPVWPPGARTANGMALCHWVQLYRYFVSQSSEFCCHNPLCCFSTSVYCCKFIIRYRFSPETYGYTLVNKVKLSLYLTKHHAMKTYWGMEV